MRLRITRRSTVFLATWVAGVAFVAWAGTWVDGYMLHVRGVPLPHPYPWQGVLISCAVLTLMSLIHYALIRPETYPVSWGRALSATLAGAIAVVALGLGLMHAPHYMYVLWLWMVLVTLISLGLFLVSVGSSVRHLLERLEIDIPEGAVAEVAVPLATTVLTHWRAPMTDGFKCELPRGLKLTAAEAAPRGSRACIFVPSDPSAFEDELVPGSVTAHPKYAGVSMPLTAHVIQRHLELPVPEPGEATPGEAPLE